MTLLIFLFGLLIGSFLNVCYYRIPNQKSIVFPGSSCGSCGTLLKPWDLIPILSWVSTKGKCRYCGEKVSIRYPIGELTTGLLSAFVYTQLGWSLELVMGLFLLYTGLVVIMIDLEHMIIPDGLNLTIMIGGILFFVYQGITFGQWSLSNGLMGMAVGFVPLFLIYLFGAMGGGDYKYMAAAGFILGPLYTGIALYFGFIVGGFVSLFLLLLKKYGLRSEIPFGPFLVFGVMIAYLYGTNLWGWYISVFLS